MSASSRHQRTPYERFNHMEIYFPVTQASGGSFAQPTTTSWDGRPHNQHPGSASCRMPKPAQPSGAQVQSHRQMGSQVNAVMVHTHPAVATARRFPEHQRHGMPIATHHYVHPDNQTTLYPHRSGELYGVSIPPNHRTPVVHGSDCLGQWLAANPHAAQQSHQRMPDRHSFNTPSTSNDISVYNRQQYWQGTTLPQGSPAHKELSTLAGATLPPSQPTPVGVLGHASPVHRETASTNPCGTGNCPVPTCQKTCSRQQELDRHVREHLPHFLCCPHQGCAWRGNRHYILRDHLQKKHTGIPSPELGEDTIYDPKGLVRQLINREIDIEQANRAVSLLVRERAVVLGKRGIWVVNETELA